MKGYKSLVAWQLASQLSDMTLEAVDSAWTPKCAGLFDQLRRAAISVDVNIVEGYALNTVPLFRRHLRIAFASAAEAERLLEMAAKHAYLKPEVGDPLLTKVDGVLGALIGLIRSRNLKQRRDFDP
jgi:four helix bundle protein